MVRPSRAFTALALCALAAGAGCGGSSSHPVDLGELLNRDYAAICKYQVACSDLPDMATCRAIVQIPGYQATLEQDIASGKIKYDANRAGACIALLEGLYGAGCTHSAQAPARHNLGTTCDSVLAGTVAPGGACFFSEECRDSGFCQPDDSACLRFVQCCPGTCVAEPPPIAAGGGCSEGQSCGGDNVCYAATSGATATCTTPLAEGAACTSTTACAAPTYCDVDPATGVGTCRRPAATGGPCNVAVGGMSCDDLRDDCDQTTAICTRRIAAGAPCAYGQSCVGYASCDGTTCVASAALGQTCGAATGIGCIAGLLCPAPGYTCMPPPAVDGACM
ncbi:MAG TPA: hypothetical protein VIF57_02090 [Polyangia bacterium]